MAGIAAFVLGCELLCRLLPVSSSTETGYYIDPQILTYPPRHHWTASRGWDLRNPQRLQSNNFGFVAERDFVRDENAVALIGDSFVEAGMLDADKRPAVQLERALGSRRPVYAMGGPGSALLDYAERIRFANQNFGVRDFVVLMERGDVMQSLCSSGNVHAPCLDRKTLDPRVEHQPPPGFAKRVFRQSALAQYVFSQLELAPSRLWPQAIAQSRPGGGSLDDIAGGATIPDRAKNPGGIIPRPEIDAVTRLFFARIAPYARGRLIIVVDSQRALLRQGAIPVDASRDRFIELARAHGADVVDTQPLFVEHHLHSRLRLDVGPYDAHFNALGAAIVMQAAAESLRRQ